MEDDNLIEWSDDILNPEYFNFPIILLEGFLINHKICLNNIGDYAIYSLLQKKYQGDFNQIEDVEVELNTKIVNKRRSFENGKTLLDSMPENLPFVGIRKKIFFDYYKNKKTEFEKVVLLAFLAIKSIVGKKSYCKTNFLLLFNRMNGNSLSIKNESELSPELRKYFTRHYKSKINDYLQWKWKLKYYAVDTRGFYVSFNKNLTLKDLIKIVEKNKVSNQIKAMKANNKAIRLEVLKEIKKPINL